MRCFSVAYQGPRPAGLAGVLNNTRGKACSNLGYPPYQRMSGAALRGGDRCAAFQGPIRAQAHSFAQGMTGVAYRAPGKPRGDARMV